jgi:uncharacterized membrane protein YeiH
MTGSHPVEHPKHLLETAAAHRLLVAADIAGTLVFAVEGAMAAVDGNLDLIGIIVLAFCTALGGGIIRDILLGALPPAALRDWRYPTIPITAAALVFFLHHDVRAIPLPALQVLDAAGLAIFAIAGTLKAMLHKMNPLVAIMLGTITAVGGGTVRDVLLNVVPNVLRFEIYATAALLGSAVMIGAKKLRLPSNSAAAMGAAVCFLLRLISLWRHWNLPRVLDQ